MGHVFLIQTMSVQVPILWKLCQKRGDSVHFLRAVILCSFCSYVFGWHVHEKAILLVTIPLAVSSVVSPSEANNFTILNTVANFSLFPLLYEDRETLIKILLCLWHFVIVIFRQSNQMQWLFYSHFLY